MDVATVLIYLVVTFL